MLKKFVNDREELGVRRREMRTIQSPLKMPLAAFTALALAAESSFGGQAAITASRRQVALWSAHVIPVRSERQACSAEVSYEGRERLQPCWTKFLEHVFSMIRAFDLEPSWPMNLKNRPI